MSSGLQRGALSQRSQRFATYNQYIQWLRTKFVGTATFRSSLDLCSVPDLELLLSTPCLPTIYSIVSALLYGAELQWPNGNISYLSRIQLVLHCPCPYNVCDLRALGHMDSPKSYEADRSC